MSALRLGPGRARRLVLGAAAVDASAGTPLALSAQSAVIPAQDHSDDSDDSDDMAARAYFSHTSQDGRSFAARITAAGHPSPAAENIAKGQRTAADVMRAWMASPGHRAHILNCDHRGMGLGHTYWVQNFGR
ncbi:CAP domain-containing protein [Actinokineospora sp. G85]|uniref:CAP domain-containing protein n=1 Tax=Actinokineospora sp. G85 TaxID=3406626 RepID=UPI003C75DB39